MLFMFLSLTSALLLLWLVFLKRVSGRSALKAPGKVLLITAHPDDECMFFSPTILALTKRAPQNVHLLCLSEGNYYNQGVVRRQELYKSAAILGICSDQVSLVSDPQLPDHPGVEWNLKLVGKHILEAIHQNDIKTVITFDLGGVSGHPNHTAIAKAVMKMAARRQTNALLLETTGLLRKYTGVLDLPLSLLMSQCCVVGTASDYFKARSAMWAHQSQYVWFRRIYICFSRYMVINTFRELKL